MFYAHLAPGEKIENLFWKWQEPRRWGIETSIDPQLKVINEPFAPTCGSRSCVQGQKNLKNESLLVVYQVLFSHHIWAKEAYSFFLFQRITSYSFKQETVWPFGEESCRVDVQNTSKYGNRMCLLAFVRRVISNCFWEQWFNRKCMLQ